MASLQRTRPPNPNLWEKISLSRWQPDTWVVPDGSVSTTSKIALRLKDALLTPHLVRLVRSTLAEWSNEDGWQSWRFLGAGTFGSAVLWRRTGADGKLLDEVVVKECPKNAKRSTRQTGIMVHSYLDEAEIMYTLNIHTGSTNIVHLRGYKVHLRPEIDPGPTSKVHVEGKEFHRFYLEYGPYGTLSNLASRYKAFNRYLPELFLWHLFNSLAAAAVALENLPDSKSFYAHLDLKPENIFLGYEGPPSRNATIAGGLDGELLGYPSIKLGDFGIAEKVKKQFNKTLTDIGGVGTSGYQAPEIHRVSRDSTDSRNRYIGQYGANWEPPLDNSREELTSKADVWAIGKVMYDLFSLSRSGHYDVLKAQSRDVYEHYGREPIPDYDRVPFELDQMHRKSPYTKQLSNLVKRCMRAEARRRPTPGALYKITKECMEDRNAHHASKLPFSVRHRKLYYRGNEINSMSIEERNCAQYISVYDWVDLTDPCNNDPDEPELDVYPEQIWEMRNRRKEQKRAHFQFQNYRNERQQQARDFNEAILRNDVRANVGSSQIVISDPDDELKYKGFQEAEWFINEQKQRRRDLRGNKGSHGGDDNDDDNDDDDNDGYNHGKPHRHKQVKVGPRGTIQTPSASSAPRTSGPASVRTQETRTRSGQNQVDQRHVMGQSGPREWQASKYVPYVFKDAHQERFENTSDGKSLIFVIDTEPDPALKPICYPNPRLTNTRKRSAESSENSGEGEEGEHSKRRRKDVAVVKREPNAGGG